MREPSFVMVYHAELDLLSDDPRALQVWLSLVRFADFKTQTCYPSIGLLATQNKASESTIRRALDRLKELGILQEESKRHPRYQTNVFQLQRLKGASTDDTPAAQECNEGVSSVIPKQEPEHNHLTRTTERDSSGGGGGNDLSSTRKERSARHKIEQRLRATGLVEWETALREAETKGICDDELRQICDQYEAQRGKFNGPGAILYRVQKGSWPVDGVSEGLSQNKANNQQKHEELCSKMCHLAYKEVRERTPVGEYVNDLEAMKVAVSKGVPDSYALEFFGITPPTPTSADKAA